MNVLIQGMRRSGTTIVFDLLSEDPRFTAFYEPLAASRPSVGGGSGLRDYDLLEPVREARAAFLAGRPEIADPALLNHGAPRDWRVEFEEDVPEYVEAYLRFLLDRPGDVLVKFTRMYCKLGVLARLDPEAPLVHIVRDPRRVAASYLFGRDGVRRDRYPGPDAFFGSVTTRSAWASRDFSDHLLTLPAYAHLMPLTDMERILLLWRFTFERTRADGLRCFGDRYLRVRHEDLSTAPEATVDSIYAHAGIVAPPAVRALAAAAVRAPGPVFAAEDRRWGVAVGRLGLGPAMEQAGYRME